METNWIAWTIMGLSFFPYWIICLKKFGLTDSISATWYEWEKLVKKESKTMINKSTLGKFWFSAMIIGTTTPVFSFMPEDTNWGVLYLIGVGGLWLTAVAGAYKKKYVEKYHVYGATIGIFFCLLGTGVILGLWTPAIVMALITATLYITKVRGATNIVEGMAVVTIWLAIGITMLNMIAM